MRNVLPLALVLALCGNAAAYDIKQLEADSQAYHGKMLSTLGGVRITQEGAMLVKERAGDLSVVMYRKGDKWRADGSMTRPGVPVPDGAQPMTTIQLFDGTDLWQAAMGTKTKLQGFSPSRGPSIINAFGSDFGDEAKIAGDEKLGERDCWIVDVPRPAPSPQMAKMVPEVTRSWVDKKNFALVQSSTKVGDKTMKTVFSDFRDVKGYQIPYVTEVFRDEEKTMTVKVIKMETNVALPDSMFDAAKLPGDEKSADLSAMMKKVEEMKQEMAARKALEARGDSLASPDSAAAKKDAVKESTPVKK